MQYKKKYINNKIIEAGRKEYLEKGYRAGNISKIASDAGVPVGNLYRYFDGKSGLLDAIVKPAYIELPHIIDKLASVDESMGIQELMATLTDNVLTVFDEYGVEILILLDGCASTRYEEFGENVTKQVSDLICGKIYATESEENKIMSRCIAKAFIGSLFDILRMNLDRDTMKSLLFKILSFYFSEIDSRK